MATKVGINGFGRIGRLVLRAALEMNACPDASVGMDFVAVNDLTDAKTLGHLFKYDSTFGKFPGEVKAEKDSLLINGKKVKVLAEKDPAKLPWQEMGVEVVVESTGIFRTKEGAEKHLAAGAKKVIITAPAKGGDILTVVMGVNEQMYNPQEHHVISNASCTTNCLAPVCKVLSKEFGIEHAIMTTIHSYTNDQRILDFQHKDLRRARAAAMSMIPTTTGAAEATALTLPELKGKITGLAIRIPTWNVSLVDLSAELKKEVTVEEVNAAFKKYADGELSRYLEYCEEPLVSRDFNGNQKSAIVDGLSTYVIDGKLVKVLAWYDNEWAYSCRVIDLINYITGR